MASSTDPGLEPPPRPGEIPGAPERTTTPPAAGWVGRWGGWDRELTANERLRCEAPRRLNRALILAAALHGALFLFSPDWIPASSDAPWGTAFAGLQVVGLGEDGDRLEEMGDGLTWAEVPGGGGESAPTPLRDSGETEGPSGEVPAPEIQTTVGGTAGPLVAGGLGSREDGGQVGVGTAALGRLGALRPQLHVPAPSEGDLSLPQDDADQGGLENGGGDGGESATEGDARDRRLRAELADRLEDRLTRDEILDLERLSALRPELALTSPSSWILVRNPGEVGEFLERRFGRPGGSERPRGTMSVAIWIDERGSVEWAEINRSSGDPELDGSALELFERVVSFSPAREDGFRVPTAVIFWLSFW